MPIPKKIETVRVTSTVPANVWDAFCELAEREARAAGHDAKESKKPQWRDLLLTDLLERATKLKRKREAEGVGHTMRAVS